MDWLRENWFWIVVAIVFIWMHTRMHGGHGHGGCGAHGDRSAAGPPGPHEGSRPRARAKEDV